MCPEVGVSERSDVGEIPMRGGTKDCRDRYLTVETCQGYELIRLDVAPSDPNEPRGEGEV